MQSVISAGHHLPPYMQSKQWRGQLKFAQFLLLERPSMSLSHMPDREHLQTRRLKWKMRNSVMQSSFQIKSGVQNIIWTDPGWWLSVHQKTCSQSLGSGAVLWCSGTWWRGRLLSWGCGSWLPVPASWNWTGQTGHWVRSCTVHRRRSRVEVCVGSGGRSGPLRQEDGGIYSQTLSGKAQTLKTRCGFSAKIFSWLEPLERIKVCIQVEWSLTQFKYLWFSTELLEKTCMQQSHVIRQILQK